jgi:hypothetical protein
MADEQLARLLHLRRTALQMMRKLEQFRPYITGAVLNGTAGEHSDIHLQLFTENAKDVEIFLLNRHIDITVTEASVSSGRRRKTQADETIHFYQGDEIFHLAVYHPDDMRKMARATDAPIERADIQALERLIAQQTTPSI